MEFYAVPGEDAFVSQGGCCERAAIAVAQPGERFAQIGFGEKATGDVAAGNEVVYVGEQSFHAGVEFIEVRDNRDTRAAGPGCGGCRRGGVMSIYVQGAGVADPVALEFFWAERQALIALPKNGALSGVIDEDESLLAWAAWRDEEMGFDTKTGKFGTMERGGVVVAEFPNVAGAESPGLAGHYGGRDLSAGEDIGGMKFDLGARSGEARQGDQCVGGVEADADQVDFGGSGHLFGPL